MNNEKSTGSVFLACVAGLALFYAGYSKVAEVKKLTKKDIDVWEGMVFFLKDTMLYIFAVLAAIFIVGVVIFLVYATLKKLTALYVAPLKSMELICFVVSIPYDDKCFNKFRSLGVSFIPSPSEVDLIFSCRDGDPRLQCRVPPKTSSSALISSL